MIAKICPCKDCVPPKRAAGCHSYCKEYIDWNAEHQEDKAKIREIHRIEYDCFPTRFRKGRKRRR